MHGVRGLKHLPAPAREEPMQGVPGQEPMHGGSTMSCTGSAMCVQSSSFAETRASSESIHLQDPHERGEGVARHCVWYSIARHCVELDRLSKVSERLMRIPEGVVDKKSVARRLCLRSGCRRPGLRLHRRHAPPVVSSDKLMPLLKFVLLLAGSRDRTQKGRNLRCQKLCCISRDRGARGAREGACTEAAPQPLLRV